MNTETEAPPPTDTALRQYERPERTSEVTLSERALLLTDLVGSTQLVVELGDERSAEIFAQHDRLARDLLARFGGLEIDKTDGFLFLFESTAEALDFALAFHAALAELSAELGVSLEARAGIHWGEVLLRENLNADVRRGAKPLEVEGVAKPTAARVMSIAGARQTLLTERAFAVVRERLEPLDPASAQEGSPPRWLSHGAYAFKGLDQPLEVFEVGHPGMAPFQPPDDTSKGAKRRRIWPWVLGAFVLTLLGQAAFEQLPIHARPTVAVLGFRNLGQAEDAWLSTALAEMLTSELAAGEQLRLIPGENVARMKLELGLSGNEPGPETLKKIRSNLATDYVVVGSYVLVEQGGEKSLRFDAALQDAKAGETLEKLAFQGQESDLFGLVSRAGSGLRQELGLKEASLAEAGAVRATLAANLEAERLYAEGLELLRDFEPKQARNKLRQAIQADPEHAFSHAALSEAFSRLGNDLRAEESASRALEIAERLGLPREELLAIQGRYFKIAKRFDRALETYRQLWELFPDNVDYGLAVAEAQTAAGDGREALVTLERLRQGSGIAAEDPRVDLAEAEAAETLADHQRQLEVADRALAKAQQQGASVLEAQIHWARGFALRRLGKPDEAKAAYDEAQRLFKAAGDVGNEARTLNSIANIMKSRGQLSDAAELYAQALPVLELIGDRSWISTVMNNQGELFRELGRLGEARRKLEASLALVREVSDPHREAVRLENLGWVLLDLGSLGKAERRGQEALAVNDQIENGRGRARTLQLLARIAFSRGDIPAAVRRYREALQHCRAIGDRQVCARVLHGMAELDLARGETDSVVSLLDEVEELRTELGERGGLAETRLTRAALRLALGRAEEAGRLAQSAAHELAREERSDAEAAAHALEARSWHAAGRRKEAEAALAVAEKREGSESPSVRLAVALAQARVLSARDRFEDARAILSHALEEARGASLAEPELEIRLALAELEAASGVSENARVRLAAVAADARSMGYGLIARQATAGSF